MKKNILIITLSVIAILGIGFSIYFQQQVKGLNEKASSLQKENEALKARITKALYYSEVVGFIFAPSGDNSIDSEEAKIKWFLGLTDKIKKTGDEQLKSLLNDLTSEDAEKAGAASEKIMFKASDELKKALTQ